MATGFRTICDQVLAASFPYTPYDVPKKPLSALLNDMTQYVASASKLENEDETIVHG